MLTFVYVQLFFFSCSMWKEIGISTNCWLGPPSIWTRMMDPFAKQSSFQNWAVTQEWGLVDYAIPLPTMFMKESFLNTADGLADGLLMRRMKLFIWKIKSIFASDKSLLDSLPKQKAKNNYVSQVLEPVPDPKNSSLKAISWYFTKLNKRKLTFKVLWFWFLFWTS